MTKSLITLVLLLNGATVAATPQVTLGPPAGNGAITVDPGSIRIFTFDEGDVVNLQLAITVHAACFQPYDLVLAASGSGDTFSNQSGLLVNLCDGDTTVFDVSFTGDGRTRVFDIEFVDDFSGAIASIPVVLSPSVAPEVTLGAPLADAFLTVDPGSILVEMLAENVPVTVQVALTIHPACFTPFDIGLTAIGDGGTFQDSTGPLVNGCSGETSVFDITLTGDGLDHTFVVDFVDLNEGESLTRIPVAVFSGDGDADDDGLADTADNCTRVANPDQLDTDSDRIGNACDPDIAIDNDCFVNFADLAAFKAAFLSEPGDSKWNPDADFNGDLLVNFGDLAVMRNLFLGPPGPSAGGCN